MYVLIGFAVLFGLMVVMLVIRTIRAGPRQMSETDLDRGHALIRISADDPGDGWQHLGSETQVDGINLRFDHDDDPQAEASLMAPERYRSRGATVFGHVLTVKLTGTFETHHIHTSGYVFRVRLRGDATVAGKEVRIQMKVEGKRPWCGRIENDDDTDAAVGGWIEIEWAEVLELPPNR